MTGEKLNGRFVLVRSKHASRHGKQWLLLHKDDEFAVPGWEAEDHPRSVLSGRTNDEVAADPDALWHSNRDAAGDEVEGKGGLEVLAKEAGKAPLATTFDPDLHHDRRGAADRRRAGRARRPRPTRAACGRSAGRTSRSPTWTRCCSRPTEGDPAGDQAGPHPLPRRVAPAMLPYLAGRPVNINRFPDGIAKKGFWHKTRRSTPPWVTRYTYEERPTARPRSTS